MSPTAQHVAAEVRAWMGRRNLRGIDLSEELGISQPQVSARVRGKLAWSLDELDTLSELFGCDVADLVPTGRPTVSVGRARRDSNSQPSDPKFGRWSVSSLWAKAA